MTSAGLSARLAIAADSAGFIGRTRELELLQASLDAACAGSGRLLMLAGEPGIGKTRTLRELAGKAAARGATVLWGRGNEGGWTPPYGLWGEALDEYVAELDSERLRQELGPATAPLAQLLPALRTALPATEPTVPLGAEEERFRLYDAVTRLLLAAARAQPLLLLLDDLHWADPDSLGLLQHVARFLRRGRLLLVGAYRDLELVAGHPLTQAMAVLLHEPGYDLVHLRGLSRDEVSHFLALRTHHEAQAALVDALYAETEGNPFYLGELLLHLVEEGRLVVTSGVLSSEGALDGLNLPESVRQVIGGRLARLSPATNRLLMSASAFTAGFEFGALQQLTGLDENALLDCIDEALAAQLIRTLGARSESYDFAHAIVRRTLYAALSPSRRLRLHRQIAMALEVVYGADAPAHAAEIAVQYHASLALPGASRGVAYAVAAAEQARASYAYEQAATYLRLASDLAGESEAAERADLLCRLAVAEAQALWFADAQQTIERSLDALQRSGSAPEVAAAFLVRAIAALKDSGARPADWKPLHGRGLALLDGRHSIDWAWLALLDDPIEPVSSGAITAGRWRSLDPEAVCIARASGSEEDYARTLRQWDRRPYDETRAMLASTASWHSPAAILRALSKLSAALLYSHGAFAEATSACRRLLEVAERYGSLHRQAEALVWQSLAQTALGDLDAAQHAAARADDLLARLGPWDHLRAQWPSMHFALAYALDGDWPALAEFWSRFATEPPAGLSWFGLPAAAMAAYAHARAGSETEAGRLLDLLAPLLERVGPETWLQSGAVALAGAAVWELGAVDLAARYLQLALDLRAAGSANYPGTSNELTAARMAALIGAGEQARDLFAAARRVLDEEGQRPLRAIVDLDEARALAMGVCDRMGVDALLGAALRQFQSLGMAGWAARAQALRERLQRGRGGGRRIRAYPDGLTQREVEVLRLLASGESNTAIAAALVLSPRTVERHIANIYGKAGIHSRRDARGYAVDRALIAPAAL